MARPPGAVIALLKHLRCGGVVRPAGFWLPVQNGVNLEGGRFWINIRKNFINSYSDPKMEFAVHKFVNASPWKCLSRAGMGSC